MSSQYFLLLANFRTVDIGTTPLYLLGLLLQVYELFQVSIMYPN